MDKVCPFCRSEIPEGASVCRFCQKEQPNPAMQKATQGAVIGCAVLFFLPLAFCMFSSGGSDKADRPASNSKRIAVTGDVVTLPAPTPCMPTEQGLEEAMRFYRNQQWQEVAAAVLADGGRVLKEGSKVTIVDRGFSQTRVRPADTVGRCLISTDIIRMTE